MIMFVETIGYIFQKVYHEKVRFASALDKKTNKAKKMRRLKNEFIITLN